MKIIYLVIGLVAGGLIGFILTEKWDRKSSPTENPDQQINSELKQISSDWSWPDSLDAVKAAPESHKIIYEDSVVRILQVILEANETEPVHTHKWNSVMWFAQATPMTYFKIGLKDNEYVIEDSITIPQMPQEVLNHGDFMESEEPHAIKNISNGNGIAYRVEFKE